MTNKELRRKKLADLIAEYGSQKAFGDAVGKDPAMFSQILNGTRNLGDKLTRDLEEKLGKPRGWMDGFGNAPQEIGLLITEENKDKILLNAKEFFGKAASIVSVDGKYYISFSNQQHVTAKQLIDFANACGINNKRIASFVNTTEKQIDSVISGEHRLSLVQAVLLQSHLNIDQEPLQTNNKTLPTSNAYLVGTSPPFKAVPIAGTAKLGEDGDYSLEQVDGNMVLDVPTSDPHACALRVVGDSMHPAIRHGWYVVIEPSVDPRNGLYVAVETIDGRRMVKELLSMDSNIVRLESVNPAHGRTTFDANEIKTIQAVTMIVQASKARTIESKAETLGADVFDGIFD